LSYHRKSGNTKSYQTRNLCDDRLRELKGRGRPGMFRWRMLSGLSLMALTGCGGGPEFASVEGVVSLDAKPIADVEVQFIPDITQATYGPPNSAYTDANGRYRITATRTSGAVVGKNRICVRDATVMMPLGAGGASGETASNPEGSVRRSRLPALYSDAARSPLGSVEIRPGSQTIHFTIKSVP